jgi:hypothetical protein
MRNAIRVDLSDSTYDFLRAVWSDISPVCGGGEFSPVEGNANEELQVQLDTLAGIDGVQILPNKIGMRGIASRIQWGPIDWGTFTIRAIRGSGARTELEKRLYAIEHPEEGLLLPHLTVQAYISERRTGHLLSAAVAYTRELIPYAHAMKKGVWWQQVKQDDGSINRFLVVRWTDYKAAGNYIEIIRPNGLQKPDKPTTEMMLGKPLDEYVNQANYWKRHIDPPTNGEEDQQA